jgi:glycosyltransferase involved in cell wall biosynthesis
LKSADTSASHNSKYVIDLTRSITNITRGIDGIPRVEIAIAREFLLLGGRTIWVDRDGSVFEIEEKDFDRILSLAPSLSVPKGSVGSFLSDLVSTGRQLQLLRSLRKKRYLPGNDETGFLFGAYWDARERDIPELLRNKFGMKIFGFVHDLIPIYHPELTYNPRKMRNAFPAYLRRMISVCGKVFVSSDFVARQLKTYCRQQNYDTPKIQAIPLASDLDLRVNSRSDFSPFSQLKPKTYALMVSTFEPRKNHELAYELWHELQKRNPQLLIPLVFAGKRGWQTSELLARIKREAKNKVPPFVVIDSPSDNDLAWLYRNARITLYPSIIEGWGLPISESLSFGTYCLASDAPALKEASQGLAWHGSIDAKERWLEEIVHCLSDDNYVAQRSAKIVCDFKTRRWSDFTHDLLLAAQR